MSRQWLRTWDLSVTGKGGQIDLSELRIRFAIHQASIQAPASAEFRIYNLSEDTANSILAGSGKNSAGISTGGGQFTEVHFSAGYQDNEAEIFFGEIGQFRKSKESPVDTFLDIYAVHKRKAYDYAFVNKSLAAGSTAQDHLNVFQEAFKKYGVTLGHVDTLPTAKYPRGVAFFGLARDYTRILASSVEMVWTIMDSKVHLISPDNAIPGSGPIKLNSTTGMVGIPTQTLNGLLVRCLINPQIKWHGQVEINQKDITQAQLDLSYQGPANNLFPSVSTDGVYNVVAIDVSGDTRAQPWYYDLTCIAVNNTSGFTGTSKFYTSNDGAT